MLVEKCALLYLFSKQPGTALIGACALIRTKTVLFRLFCESFVRSSMNISKDPEMDLSGIPSGKGMSVK